MHILKMDLDPTGIHAPLVAQRAEVQHTFPDKTKIEQALPPLGSHCGYHQRMLSKRQIVRWSLLK